MNINRRSFLKTGAITGAGIMFGGNKLLASLIQESSNFRVVRGNVGVYSERGGTIGWYLSDDAVVVVDSQFPDTAANMIVELKKKTSGKIDVLFNTHHHGDHTSGNFYLKDFTKSIVASEDALRLQKANYGSGENAAKQAYADATFKESWKLNIGDETISARHLKAAHTGGDAVLHFEKTNVAHMGDLVFNGVFPYIDIDNGECNIPGWIVNLEQHLNYFDNDTMFIFGHGKSITGSKKELNNMKVYFESILDFVSKQRAAGKSDEEIANSESIPGYEDMMEAWPGARKMNLEGALRFL
ncbi:MAG: MBL fold metallo-hydrolase [Melioribacteraceae bacterium]|nr:MBL fold metallo-hydrolase [Melioribacteraceae bacterium]MCF8266161.1 MBL fold metallo-hydrolase [Melioribacteraceae bacterium]MCF8431644.1 MBL fold metallo-hydrolase [Melioribacteraceae bacterium]